MKKLKKLLALGLALTMLGSMTACGDQGADKNAELLNKISTLETQMSDMKTELGGQIVLRKRKFPPMRWLPTMQRKLMKW